MGRDAQPAIGLRRFTVRLVEHEPAWAALFASEAAEIRRHAGEGVVDVQHVGSTAVPGLMAKPILDIAVAVSTPETVPIVAHRLGDGGYIDRGSAGRDGGHLVVKEAAPDVRTVHIHIVDVADPQWRDYLRFRDMLRDDEALRRVYGVLKTSLARACADNRRMYTTGKHSFIRSLLAES